MHEAGTPDADREPDGLIRLLRLGGYADAWPPDCPSVDGLTWPEVMESLVHHPALAALEQLYKLPAGVRPRRLTMPRQIRPGEFTPASLQEDYAIARHKWRDWHDPVVLDWCRGFVLWHLLVAVLGHLKKGALVASEHNGDDGPLYGLSPPEPGLWRDPRMTLNLRTGAFGPEVFRPEHTTSGLPSYTGLRLHARSAVAGAPPQPPAETRPRPTNPKVRAWLQKRVAEWPDDKSAPTEAECFDAVSQHFAPGLSRDQFRIIRRKETPRAWWKQGRRPLWGKAKQSAAKSANPRSQK